MLVTLILGLIAGVAAPYAESHIKAALEYLALAETALSDAEMRALTLAISLFAAAILATILATGGAVVLTFGATLGVFGPRLITRFTGRND